MCAFGSHHGCKPWISVLCWPQINLFLLEKYLSNNLKLHLKLLFLDFVCVCYHFSALKSGALSLHLLPLCSLPLPSPPGYSVHGTLQARTLKWVALPFSRGYSWRSTQGSNLGLLNCRQILYHLTHQESPLNFGPTSKSLIAIKMKHLNLLFKLSAFSLLKFANCVP